MTLFRPFLRSGSAGARVALALLVASVCSNGKEGAQRYDEAWRLFDRAAASRAAEWASPVAAAYLDRLAAGNEAPSGEVLNQFQPDVVRLNRFVCEELQALGKLAKSGPGELVDRRVDQARIMAQEIVFDAMASALLQQALAAGPEERDRLLAGLNVEAVADDGTKLEGVAALQDAGVIDIEGRFALPARDTREHVRYEKWASRESEGFASRVDLLTEPTIMRIEQCLPPP